MEALQRHKTAVTAVILFAVSLLLMFLSGRVKPGKRGGGIAEVVNRAVGFTQYGVSGLLDGVRSGVGKYTGLLNVVDENRRLKKRLEEMQPLISGFRRLQRENMRLRELVGYTARHPEMETITAHVVARSLNPYFRIVRIRIAVPRGKRIPERAALLVPAGVVGRVIHSFGPYADCLLLSDQRSRVPAYAPDKQVQGVVIGRGADVNYRMVFRVLASEKPLPDGTLIVTSGRDGVFPEGLEIGRIMDAGKRKQSGLYMDYPVDPSARVEDIHDLLVVTGTKGAGK